MKHIGMMHCKECEHTFELRYDGFYDTHHCGGHESTKHVVGCRGCAKAKLVPMQWCRNCGSPASCYDVGICATIETGVR